MPPLEVWGFFSRSACHAAVVVLWSHRGMGVVERNHMAFLNKQQVERFEKETGVDLSGMTWQQKQKAVSDYMKEHAIKGPTFLMDKRDGTVVEESVDDRDAEIARLKAELEKAKSEQPVPQVPVVFEKGRNVPQPSIEDYENVVLIASPEQRPVQYQNGKWYENVGTQKDTEEVSFDIGRQSPFHDRESGTKNATYRVTETGRPVTATSTMPKYSALITYRPTRDLCAIAEYGGHRGYLWTHQRLPNIKGMLEQMDAYEEYKGEWKKQAGRMFYLAGLLCCDISFTDHMMSKIQRELRKRGDE